VQSQAEPVEGRDLRSGSRDRELDEETALALLERRDRQRSHVPGLLRSGDPLIPFSVLTIEHKAGTNTYDTKFARNWCRTNGVKQLITVLDMDAFLDVEVQRFASDLYVTDNVYSYLQLKLFEQVEEMGGYAVLGGGEQLFSVDTEKKATLGETDVYLDYDAGFAVPFEWCKRNGTSHQPCFFLSSSELALAYHQIPLVAAASSQPESFRHPMNKYLFKRFVYHSVFSELESRAKYGGFERVSTVRAAVQQKLRADFGPMLHPVILPLPTVRGQLSPP
jgi:hypothetical protein